MERFWSKVAIGGPDDCWLWTACKNKDGYGSFGWGGKGSTVLAHRFAWMLERDLIHAGVPDGMYVLHSCDTPSCVNPAHLWLGTQKDNVADCTKKGRRAQVRYKKLSQEQREEIKRLYATGLYTLAELGRRYGVSYVSIRYHV